MPAGNTVVLLPSEEPTSPVYAGETGMKSNLKWYAMRGVMLLASSAAAFAFVVDHARRW